MSKQLEGVKVGDVIKCARRFDHITELFIVESVTATIARCSHEKSFRIDSGLLIGTAGGGIGSWDRRYGTIASADDIAAIRQAQAIRRAQVHLAKFVVTADNLAAVEALLAQGVK